MTDDDFYQAALKEDGQPISAGMREYHCKPGELTPMIVRLNLSDVPGSQRDKVLMAIERIIEEAKQVQDEPASTATYEEAL